MLLRFGVQNHLSIRDAQELSLVASKLKDDESGLIRNPGLGDERVLPAAVIYGANASGKSNLIAALEFMRTTVLYSHSRGEPGARVPRTPFALDPESATASSRFDADFIAGGIRYHYGFEASDIAFTSEWLYSFPNNRRQTLFERTGQAFSFGRNLRGRNQVIADLTRPNSLFVAAAAQNDHEELSKVTTFFQSIRSDTDTTAGESNASARLARQAFDGRIVDFLREMGTGITSYRRRKRVQSDFSKNFAVDLIDLLKKHMPEEAAKSFEASLDDIEEDVEFGHGAIGPDPVFFDIGRESAGTRRLCVLLGPVFNALDSGGILAIDELDASLHTRACEAVLALFSDPESNPKGAQIIATTHDTNLLSSRYIRRDQVWLVEKDRVGATHLYPLTDIRTRKGDNIEKGYLQGRFGAIPFAGPPPVLASEP
jgi:AAA15 family ATPase/GTPase